MSKISGIPAMSVDMKTSDCSFGFKKSGINPVQSSGLILYQVSTKKTTKLAVNQNKIAKNPANYNPRLSLILALCNTHM